MSEQNPAVFRAEIEEHSDTSRENRGAVENVLRPSLRGFARSASELNEIRGIRLDGQRILIADDSSDNQKLFQRILVSAGALVDVADNGEVAVEMQSRHVYDAIIMDIRMPVLDGYAATQRIRANDYKGPVIALTAHATEGEAQRCRDAGCSDFHLKPIDRLGLLRAVESGLQRVR